MSRDDWPRRKRKLLRSTWHGLGAYGSAQADDYPVFAELLTGRAEYDATRPRRTRMHFWGGVGSPRRDIAEGTTPACGLRVAGACDNGA